MSFYSLAGAQQTRDTVNDFIVMAVPVPMAAVVATPLLQRHILLDIPLA
jgi:hypothetical protein